MPTSPNRVISLGVKRFPPKVRVKEQDEGGGGEKNVNIVIIRMRRAQHCSYRWHSVSNFHNQGGM